MLKLISPQAANIHNLLKNSQPLSAKEIASELGILPNAVYRAVKSLLELGLTREIHQYPIKYQALASRQAMDLCSTIVNQSIQRFFGFKELASPGAQLLPLMFIRTRNDLLKHTQKDTRDAKSEINYIVSGLEVPAETILAQKLAIERGVKVRLIVQNLQEAGFEILNTWKGIGAKVRHFPNIEARIFIFDNRVVYITSYNSKQAQEAVGIRFEYSPLAKLMNELFEQRWSQAKDIESVK